MPRQAPVKHPPSPPTRPPTAPNTDSAEVTIIGRLAAQLPLDLPLVRLVLFGPHHGLLEPLGGG